MDIKISVKNKRASGDGTVIVCGNNDYRAVFELDEEWSAYPNKTMRVGMRNGKYVDVEFEGSFCPIPVIRKRPWIAIGLFAGDLHTSTPAMFRCTECITDRDTEPLEQSGEPELKTLTIKLGDTTEIYEYSGVSDKLIEIKDASEVRY